jgi:hypothetical protein
VLDKELRFLQESFGLLIVIGFKYVIWPFLKTFGGRFMRKCEYGFFNKNKNKNIYFYIFIISGKWWNALVEYVNPPPAAGAAPPINLEELLRQQVTLLGQIKELLAVERAAPVQACVAQNPPENLDYGTGVPGLPVAAGRPGKSCVFKFKIKNKCLCFFLFS